MARYYSEDFRLRVLERIDTGMSKMQAHRSFGVSRSTLDDWLGLRAAQGHVRDKARVQVRRVALSEGEVVWRVCRSPWGSHAGANGRRLATRKGPVVEPQQLFFGAARFGLDA